MPPRLRAAEGVGAPRTWGCCGGSSSSSRKLVGRPPGRVLQEPVTVGPRMGHLVQVRWSRSKQTVVGLTARKAAPAAAAAATAGATANLTWWLGWREQVGVGPGLWDGGLRGGVLLRRVAVPHRKLAGCGERVTWRRRRRTSMTSCSGRPGCGVGKQDEGRRAGSWRALYVNEDQGAESARGRRRTRFR